MTVALLALWVGGRRERRSRAFARNAALTRFVLEMRHNAVLQARGARMVEVLLSMRPEQVPAGLPPCLSIAALEELPADAYWEDRVWRLPSRRAPLHAAAHYLASLRLQVAD